MAKKVKAPKNVVKKDIKVTPIAGSSEESEVKVGKSLTVPADSRIVFGGLVIKGVPHPFGFTVDRKLTEDEMAHYGVGNGVTYHCNAGLGDDIKHTYKVVY